MKENVKNVSSLKLQSETTETGIFKLSLTIMAASFLTWDNKLVFKLIFPNKLINLYVIPGTLPQSGSDVMFFH